MQDYYQSIATMENLGPLEPVSIETGAELEYPEPLDQLLINLDHILKVAHGTRAYFESNPRMTAFVVDMNMDSSAGGDPERASLVITPDHVRILNNMAFHTYLDIASFGGVANELAMDIVKSWKDVDNSWEQVFTEDLEEGQT